MIVKREYPPGLPRNPIFGNVREIRRDSLAFLLSATGQYGDIISFRFMFFPGLLVNHPDYIRHVLQDNQKYGMKMILHSCGEERKRHLRNS
ncbi:MAG: hypothetical protein A2W35_03200 [Chloroflexi bacterium RBG_16_57_11]|nr:MAG: hypothetical protein A2W35_03200 [Chloroflexi bacterium RBG_16_57_11]